MRSASIFDHQNIRKLSLLLVYLGCWSMIAFGIFKQFKIAFQSWHSITAKSESTGHQYQYLTHLLASNTRQTNSSMRISYLALQSSDENGKLAGHIHSEIQYVLSPLLIEKQSTDADLFLIHQTLSDPYIEISTSHP